MTADVIADTALALVKAALMTRAYAYANRYE